jgi:hypothetical protein
MGFADLNRSAALKMWRTISGADSSRVNTIHLIVLFQHLMERISRGRLAGIEILYFDVSYGSKDLGKTKALCKGSNIPRCISTTDSGY